MSQSSSHAADPFRVLHILRAPLGGAFRHVRDLVRAQSAIGAQVGLVYNGPAVDNETYSHLIALEPALALGLNAIRIPRRPGYRDAVAITKLRSLCRSLAPAIIHGHGAKGAAYARLLAASVSAKAVCTPHGGVLHYESNSLAGMAYLTLERLLKRRTDGMIFESRYARELYAKRFGEMRFPHAVIPNGLNEEDFAVLDDRQVSFDFAYVGEFRKLKGVFVLVDAVRRALQSQPFRVLIAGSGPEDQRLRNMIGDFGLAKTVVVSEPIHPARRVFSQARCLVVPSMKESMPYIVLEALAAGMPVIATAVGGIPEIFGPDAHRLLPPGDFQALADRLVTTLQQPEDARERALSLRRQIQKHLSVPEMASRICAFYDQL